MKLAISVVVWPIAIGTGAFSAYLVGLTALAAVARMRRKDTAGTGARRRFAVLAPAHNEESIVARTINSIQAVNYPVGLVETFVIADNCSDSTARIARDLGATVFERDDPQRIGKGQAIAWALERVPVERFDAIALIDADSTVSEGFFDAMSDELDRGASIVQSNYAVTGAKSTSSSLRSIGFALMHYVRPLGKRVFGGSCGLKGNGMVFTTEVMSESGWESFSVTEDAEQHARLLCSGHSVRFAPDATVWSEMPSTLAGSTTQNLRWEAGRMQVLKRWFPRLAAEGLRRRSLTMLDGAFELLLPPLSVVSIGAVAVTVAGLLQGNWPLAILGVASIIGLVLHVIGGLLVAGVPFATWRSLLAAPFYMLWKLGVYVRALAGSGTRDWVRTARPPADG